MAKVGIERYSTVGGNITLEYGVFFTKKDGFYCSIPKEILAAQPTIESIRGINYDDAVKKTTAYIDKFYKDGFKQQKVILYYLKYCVPKEHTKLEGDYNDNCISFNDSFRTISSRQEIVDFKLNLHYRVMYMITVGGHVYISDREVTDLQKINRCSRWHWSPHGGYSTNEWMQWEFMIHTNELEEWFKSTTTSLGKLIGKVAEFFGKDKEHLLKNISDNKQKLLG